MNIQNALLLVRKKYLEEQKVNRKVRLKKNIMELVMIFL